MEELAGEGKKWAGEALRSVGIQHLHCGGEETEALVTKAVSDRSQVQVTC